LDEPKPKPENSTINDELIVKEYQIILDKAMQVEQFIWQTAAIFVVFSVGGITLLPKSKPGSWQDLLLPVIVGSISITVLLLWHRIVRNWFSIQQILFFRAEEIEELLGLWGFRYVAFMQLQNKYQPISTPLSDIDRERLQRVQQSMKSNWYRFSVRRGISAITYTLITGWLAFIVWQLLITLDVL
jgi:hypothetical protein